MTKYYLNPPTEEYGPAGGGRLFIRYRLTRGISLMRNNGVWSEIRFPTEDIIREADRFYLGGSVHEIDKVTYDNLTSQGYGANVFISTTTTSAAVSGANVLSVASTSDIVIGYKVEVPNLLPISNITNIGTNQITISGSVLAAGLTSGVTLTITK